MASPSSKLVDGGSATSVHFGPAAAVIFAMFMTGLLVSIRGEFLFLEHRNNRHDFLKVLMYFFYDYLGKFSS